jgi:hypothetical protein
MDRPRYQREVERLLDDIRIQVRELRRLHAAGARGPALSDSKRELAETRTELAELVVSGQPVSASL